MIPVEIYTIVYINIILFASFFVFLHNLEHTGMDTRTILFSESLSFVLFGSTVLFIGFRPVSWIYFGDTGNYAVMFSRLLDTEWLTPDSDIIFNFFCWFCAQYSNLTTFFMLVGLAYVGSLYWACRRMFASYNLYGFIMCLGAYSFWSYGTNGIRNGLATSLFILAFSFKDVKIIMIPIMLLAYGIHESVALPIAAFVLTLFYNNSLTYVRFWFLSILLSLALGSTLESLFASLGFAGERFTTYMTDNEYASQFSKTGFRWDFLFYSASAVAIGYYNVFKKGFNDVFYNHLFNTYLLSNAFWIFIIRASFSNRFAYLSWFLLPLVIIYPFLKQRIYYRQLSVIGLVIMGHYAFTYLMIIVLHK